MALFKFGWSAFKYNVQSNQIIATILHSNVI